MMTSTKSTRSKPHAGAWLLAASLAAAAGSAQAETYVETFSGPLNPTLWNLNALGNDYQVSGGELIFTRHSGDSSRLSFLPELIGNFDVSFEYRLIQWDYIYAAGDRLQLDVSSGGVGHAVGRAQELGASSRNGYFGKVADRDCCASSYLAEDSVGHGALRIVRADGIVSVMFKDGSGSWETLQQSVAQDHRNLQAGFSAYIHNGYYNGTSYAIDNFRLSAEGFTAPVPEPSHGAMLACGLAIVSWLTRRRRRPSA